MTAYNFYHNASLPNFSLNAVHSYFKWMNDNVQDVWMLGETGFSGTDSLCNQVVGSQTGEERDQYDYANSTMQTSLECGCKGYAWWQYQEVNWQNCREDHYGLVTHFPDERLKAAHSLFPEFKNRTAVHSCVQPNSYYNIWEYPYPNISGVVKDESSNPVKDALVVAWSDTHQSGYSTFTNSQGEYTIYTNPDTVLFEMRVSHIGYDDKRFFIGNSMPPTTTLTHINYNGWKKNWTNGNYPISGDSLEIGESDAFVVGNFYGDEAQEFLLVNFATGTASLYGFHTSLLLNSLPNIKML